MLVYLYYGLIALFVLVAYQPLTLAHGQTPSRQQQRRAGNQPQPKPAVSPSPSQTAVQQPQTGVESSKSEGQKSEGDQSTFTDWIQVGINTALLIIIAFQTAIYWQQRKIMQTQIDHARVADRAYVGVAHIGLSELVVGLVPTITAIMQNAGRTPAWKVRAPGQINLAEKRPKQVTLKSKFESDQAVLAAGATRTAVYEFGEVCDPVMKAQIESGKITVFFWSDIWYDDAWGTEHHTPLFLEWNPLQKAFVDRREREYEKRQQNPN